MSNSITDLGSGLLIIGNDGNATLEGSDRDDTIIGGAGNDWLIGGQGNDSLNGGAGYNAMFFYTGDGNDTVTSSSGYDWLYFNQTIDKNSDIDVSGRNLIINYGEDDSVTLENFLGNFHSARYIEHSGGEIDLYSLDYTINGTENDDTIYGLNGKDVINGADGNDWLIGGQGNDILNGGAGNNAMFFYAGYGHDTITAGGGLVIY